MKLKVKSNDFLFPTRRKIWLDDISGLSEELLDTIFDESKNFKFIIQDFCGDQDYCKIDIEKLGEFLKDENELSESLILELKELQTLANNMNINQIYL